MVEKLSITQNGHLTISFSRKIFQTAFLRTSQEKAEGDSEEAEYNRKLSDSEGDEDNQLYRTDIRELIELEVDS